MSSTPHGYRELKYTMMDAIQDKLTREGIPLAPEILERIANDFIITYENFSAQIASSEQAHLKKDGEIVWTNKRNELIHEFAEILNIIFSPLGGLNPGDASAYWSGMGLHRAEEFGIDFAKTIPGYILNQIHPTLKLILTSQAYLPDDHIDTSTDMGLWEAMSALYAKGTVEEANIFLIDGMTSQYSILWNTELHTLRTQQMAGTITNIWINTLKPQILIQYRALLEQKKLSTDPDEKLAIDADITQLLKNKNHWIKEDINESRSFSLKISGLTNPLKTVSYHKIAKITQSWVENSRLIKKIKQISDIFHRLTTNRLMVEKNYDRLLELHSKLEALDSKITSPRTRHEYLELDSKFKKLGLIPTTGSPIKTTVPKTEKKQDLLRKKERLVLASLPSIERTRFPELGGLSSFTMFKRQPKPTATAAATITSLPKLK